MNQFVPGSAKLASGLPMQRDAMTRKSASNLSYLPMTIKSIDEPRGECTAAINSLDIEDMQREVMHSGCWLDVIKEMKAGKARWPSVLLSHEWSAVAGKVVDAWEEAGRLVAKMKFNLDTQLGRDTFSNLKFNALGEFSVGFLPAPDGRYFDSKGVSHVTRVERFPEVSVTLVGASPGTGVLALKSRDRNVDPATAEALRWIERNPAAFEAMVLEKLNGGRQDSMPKPTPEDEIDAKLLERVRKAGGEVSIDTIRMNGQKAAIMSAVDEEAYRLYLERTREEINEANRAAIEANNARREKEARELREFAEQVRAASPEHVRAGWAKPKTSPSESQS